MKEIDKTIAFMISEIKYKVSTEVSVQLYEMIQKVRNEAWNDAVKKCTSKILKLKKP